MGVSYGANQGQARIVATRVSRRAIFLRATVETSAPLCRIGQFYRMVEKVDFPRAGKRAPPRSPRRADDQYRGAVTQEVLDVARYITDVTAQLEAAAIAAHLDRLAYFLGMAKVESEMLVRMPGPRS